MTPFGLWCLGIFAASLICFASLRILDEVMDRIEHIEPYERLLEAAEGALHSTATILFFSLPVAAVWGCYQLGAAIWSLLP